MIEKTAHIYKFDFRWTELNKEGERIDNATQFTKAFCTAQDDNQINTFMTEWWRELALSDKYIALLPKLITSKVHYEGEQVWWLEWFNHCTHNTFETEEEAFSSLHKFLESKKVIVAYREGKDPNSYCSMGACDRWRWELCKCSDCTIQQVTRIKH